MSVEPGHLEIQVCEVGVQKSCGQARNHDPHQHKEDSHHCFLQLIYGGLKYEVQNLSFR